MQHLTAPAIRRQLTAEGVVNVQTGKPYSLSTIRQDVAHQPVREMIGRTGIAIQGAYNRPPYRSVDRTIPDYPAWDKLRRGKLRGFEVAGLICQPINQTITAFELGGGVTMTLDVDDEQAGKPEGESDPKTDEGRVYTDRLIERCLKRNLPTIVTVEEDAKGLGDQYYVVNSDGSISIPSPETVALEHDPLDYRRLVKVTITTKLDQATVTDVYTETARTVTTKWNVDPYIEQIQTFPNLIGRIPVVHRANDKSTNEIYGHPIYEALFRIFDYIDKLVEKARSGVDLLGNPVVVFAGIDDVKEMIDRNKAIQTEPYYDVDGNQGERMVLNWDDKPVILLPTGAEVDYISPERGFTTDLLKVIDSFFLIVCQYTRIPPFILGLDQELSAGTLEALMLPFAQYIERRRLQLLGEGSDDLLKSSASGGLYELIDLWLRTMRLTDPKIVVAPVKATFQPITPENAQVLLQSLIWLKGIGAIRNVTALEKLHLVSDPNKEVEQAKAEAQQNLPLDWQTMLSAAAHQETNPPKTVNSPEAANITSAKPPLPAGGRRARLQNGKRVGETAGVVTGIDSAFPEGVDPEIVVQNGHSRRRRRRRTHTRVA